MYNDNLPWGAEYDSFAPYNEPDTSYIWIRGMKYLTLSSPCELEVPARYVHEVDEDGNASCCNYISSLTSCEEEMTIEAKQLFKDIHDKVIALLEKYPNDEDVISLDNNIKRLSEWEVVEMQIEDVHEL